MAVGEREFEAFSRDRAVRVEAEVSQERDDLVSRVARRVEQHQVFGSIRVATHAGDDDSVAHAGDLIETRHHAVEAIGRDEQPKVEHHSTLCALGGRPTVAVRPDTIARWTHRGSWLKVNIGRLVAPLDDPAIDDFRPALAAINLLAESSPRFVWRMEGEADATGSTDVRWPDAPDDPLFIVNMSVWEDLGALRHFVYRSGHAQYLRRRREFFEPMGGPIVAAWWVPPGHLPSLVEARDCLADLRAHGPSDAVFPVSGRG